MMALVLGLGLLYTSGDVLPGVSSAGVDLGGKSEVQASAALADRWGRQGLLLRDGTRTWAIGPTELGIALDAAATANRAQAWGRSDGGFGGMLESLISGSEIEPVLTVDLAVLTAALQNAKSLVDLPAINAGVQLVNGQAAPSPAVEGRALDVAATAERVRLAAGRELADGALDLIMLPAAPTIVDSTPLVAQANALLASPFTVVAYDPVRDEQTPWSAPPEVWAGWITASSSSSNPTGLTLSLNPADAAAFLQANAVFPDERSIDVGQAVAAMQSALAQGQTSATVRVWHGPTTYTVQPGQTLAAIAEEVGIPYPYIQAENPDINTEALSVGQVIRLPSRDILIPLDVVFAKRIVIDRSDQHLWAYENGQVIFDWVISTGLPSSPTALGVFQVQSHEENAYADQWNLYMPNFMGFYHPGPNMDLMNGFHGFPTRGSGYLLWTDDLGTPVTYGCVLLSLENAETLFSWAQDGVVVEVRA